MSPRSHPAEERRGKAISRSYGLRREAIRSSTAILPLPEVRKASPFSLNYILDEFGSADIRINNGSEELEMHFTYLTHPLEDLARLACALIDEDPYSRLDCDIREELEFDAEGGGWVMKVSVVHPPKRRRWEPKVYRWKQEDLFRYDITWHDEFSRREKSPGRLVLTGEALGYEIAYEVLRNLDDILATFGFEGYRDRWLSHDFPLLWHARLALLAGRARIDVPLGILNPGQDP